MRNQQYISMKSLSAWHLGLQLQILTEITVCSFFFFLIWKALKNWRFQAPGKLLTTKDFSNGKKKYYLSQILNFGFIKNKIGMVKLKLDRGLLQKIVGHSNSDITAHYTHLDTEQLVEFIDLFNY